MASTKRIYVVYDPRIETSTTLSKFLGIVLEKAGFPIKQIEIIPAEDYLSILDLTQNVRDHYIICLNKTYSDISLKIGHKLGEPTFKFFSRFYNNPEKRVIVLGLLNNIDHIFSDELIKKSSWTKLVTFNNSYKDIKDDGTEDHVEESPKKLRQDPMADELEPEPAPSIIEDVPTLIEEVQSPPPPTPSKLSIPVVAKEVTPKLEIKDNRDISYEDLRDFYEKTSKFFDMFEDIQKILRKIK